MDGTILIVDDVAANRIVLKAKLGAACYRPILATTGEEALRLAQQARPDLILLNLLLPDRSGVKVMTMLRAHPLTRDIPVIALTASQRPEDRLEAFAAGADEVLGKFCDDTLLLARVRNLLRARQEIEALPSEREAQAYGLAEEGRALVPPGILAIVSDRRDFALLLRRNLATVLRDRIVLVSPEDALGDIDPDRAVADLYLVDGSDERDERCRRLISDLRSRSATRHAGICLMGGEDRLSERAAMAFDLGANDFLRSGMDVQEVAARLKVVLRRKHLADRRRASVRDGLRMAVIDPVTGLYNRRYGLARMAAIAQQPAAGRPLAVLVADLDRFKSVNDRFGHAAGDQVLIEIGRRLGAILRPDDLLVRLGGEEFLIALPETDLADAHEMGDRLRRCLQERPILLEQGQAVAVTASFGLAMLDGPRPASRAEAEARVQTLVAEADAALLSAKNGGRNRLTISVRHVA